MCNWWKQMPYCQPNLRFFINTCKGMLINNGDNVKNCLNPLIFKYMKMLDKRTGVSVFLSCYNFRSLGFV
jgi:hypothetical protein